MGAQWSFGNATQKWRLGWFCQLLVAIDATREWGNEEEGDGE